MSLIIALKSVSVLSGKENKTQDLPVAAHFIKRPTWVRKLWSSRQLMHIVEI